MSWRGLFTGALALIALQAVLSTNQAAGRVGDMLDHLADLTRRAIDPSVPAIPDLRGGGSSPEADNPVSAAATSTPNPRRRQPDDGDDNPMPRLPRPGSVQTA